MNNMQTFHEQLQDDMTLDKYVNAGKLANRILGKIITDMSPGANIRDVLFQANKFAQVEFKKSVNKGSGFCYPVCVSLNNSVNSSANHQLKVGDLAKIELGIHIDCFPALICYTHIVGDIMIAQTDKRSRTLKACVDAARDVLSQMTPGTKTTDIISAIQLIAHKYGCSLPICDTVSDTVIIPGVMSYQVSKNIIDGNNDGDDDNTHRFLLHRQNPRLNFEPVNNELEENEIYAIDILMSSGTGKLTVNESQTHIYRRNQSKYTELKLKSSKQVLHQFRDHFPQSIQAVDASTKLGLRDCAKKAIINTYPAVEENETEFVSRIKFTVVVRDTPILITGRDPSDELNKIEH